MRIEKRLKRTENGCETKQSNVPKTSDAKRRKTCASSHICDAAKKNMKNVGVIVIMIAPITKSDDVNFMVLISL